MGRFLSQAKIDIKRLRQRGRLFFFVLCLLTYGWFGGAGSVVLAQEIDFQAEVNTTNVALGSYLRLTLTVNGMTGLEPQGLPDLEDFDWDYIGPSSRVSIVNGQQFSSQSFSYQLYPQKTGTFEIPPIHRQIQGKDYSTQALTITVVEQKAATQEVSPGQSQRASLKDRLFLIVQAGKDEVYRYEKIPVTIRLYVGDISVKDVKMSKIQQTGFLVDDFQQKPRQFQQVMNGLRYNVVEFQTWVSPVRTGTMTLGPVTAHCGIVFQDAGKRQRSGFFDDSFFDSFFTGYKTRPVELQSNRLDFNVRPLPIEGRPQDFSGAVGKFSFNMSVQPQKVTVGDPVTVRMTVAGEGNLKTFDLKGLESGLDFKVYDPQVKEDNGVKVLEQVVIPQHEGPVRIPEVRFSFFDTGQQSYRTISWGPVDLAVDPVAQGQGFAVVGLPQDSGVLGGKPEQFGRDIAFIKDRLGRVSPSGYRTERTPVFIVLMSLILIGWLAGVRGYAFHHRLRHDERFARRLKAPGYARSGLQQAQRLRGTEQTDQFYDVLYQTLQKYFSHKLHLPPGAVSLLVLKERLAGHPDAETIARSLQGIWTRCEAARYAAVQHDGHDMARSCEEAREVIDWFERHF